MRIIAGRAKGRNLSVPRSGTRPTSQKVREALFSSLERLVDWDGSIVLDLFAGSGSLGLEALSRGAASAVFVEKSRAAAQVCARNLETTGLNGKVVHTGVNQFLSTYEAPAPFDLVFIDPPYSHGVDDVLERLAAARLLTTDAVVVAEISSGGSGVVWPEEFEDVRTRRYGDTAVEVAFWNGEAHPR